MGRVFKFDVFYGRASEISEALFVGVGVTREAMQVWRERPRS